MTKQETKKYIKVKTIIGIFTEAVNQDQGNTSEKKINCCQHRFFVQAEQTE
jgi:hypothetical protein